MVLCWQGRLFDEVRRRRDHRRLDGPAEVLLELARTSSPALETTVAVGVARLGIGAPTAAIVVKELAALGVEVGSGFAWARRGNVAPLRPDTVGRRYQLSKRAVQHTRPGSDA